MQGLQTAFYAVMIALLFYNTCLFFILRHRGYGVYLVFLIAAIIQCGFSDGTLIQLFHLDISFNARIVNPRFRS